MFKLQSVQKAAGATYTAVGRHLATALVAGAAMSVTLSVNAFELDFDDPTITGFIDTTITASVAMTTKTAPPWARAPSGRNVLFDSAGEVYSAPVSFITDAGLNWDKDWGRWGVFARFGYLYDFEMMDGANKCTNCSGSTPAGTLDGVPEGARNEYNAFTLYDLFFYSNFEIAGHPATLRVGKQVMNWGESSIMGGGLSTVINPSDLAKSTVPGVEVKETLLPQEMVSFSYAFTDNTNIEAYYVWNWRRSQFIPVGSFFSPFDFIGQGFNPDLNVPGVAARDTDHAKRGGQWGVSLHHIIESLNYMDLGLYWVRSHAQQPYLQANYDPAGPGTIPGLFTTYHEVFSEDQDTYAVSLNGEVGDTGISFQTEVTMRENFWDTRECQNFFGLAGILGAISAAPFPTSWTPAYPGTGGVPGCENENNDVYTWLGNLTYSIGGGPFGADQQSYLFDWQLQWVDGQNRGDATDKVSFSSASPVAHGFEASPGVDQLDRLVTDFSWGYSIVAAYAYNNLFWNLNVKPTFVWIHNVEGYEPFNSGALVENQRTVSMGVEFEYQGKMSLKISYAFWPGKEGTWSDRDNVSAVFKYSF